MRQVFADAPKAARGSTGPGFRCVGEDLTHPTNRPQRGCGGGETKRIRGDSDFLSIPREGFNSETPLRWPDPVDQVSTLWITLPPSGPTKWVSRAGLAVSAVAPFGCQKASCFCSWTLWTTTLTLRIRFRPSGSAPIEQQGQRVIQEVPILGRFVYLKNGL